LYVPVFEAVAYLLRELDFRGPLAVLKLLIGETLLNNYFTIDIALVFNVDSR